jgi:HPt (histidine-containing phosphotransfer) domain-containing protein
MGFDGYIAKPVTQDALRDEILRVSRPVEEGLPDEARLLKQCADDAELVDELLALFREGLEDALAAIVQAIAHDDRDALRRAAHKLRGEALALDFTDLTHLLQRLESDAQTLDDGELKTLRDGLYAEASRIMAWLQRRAQEVNHDA